MTLQRQKWTSSIKIQSGNTLLRSPKRELSQVVSTYTSTQSFFVLHPNEFPQCWILFSAGLRHHWITVTFQTWEQRHSGVCDQRDDQFCPLHVSEVSVSILVKHVCCLKAEAGLKAVTRPGKSRTSPLQTLYNGDQVRTMAHIVPPHTQSHTHSVTWGLQLVGSKFHFHCTDCTNCNI